jgi:hypothetical protein
LLRKRFNCHFHMRRRRMYVQTWGHVS